MKTLGLLLLAIVVTCGFLRLRELNLAENAKTRAHAEKMLAEMRAISDTPGPPREPAHSGNWVTTRDVVGNYHTRELQPGVSYAQSIGMGGYSGPIKPTPKPRTMLDQPAHR